MNGSRTLKLVHGKRSTYVNKLCRCDLCKGANAKYKRDKTAYYKSIAAPENLKEGLATIQEFIQDLTHGLPATYEWYGCRCEDCKEAVREAWRTAKFLERLRAS